MWFVDARLTSQLSYHKSSVETDLGRHRFGSNLSSAERFKKLVRFQDIISCCTLAAFRSMASLNDGE